MKLAGAVPVTQELVQEMMASWPKGTPIVTYCHLGIRSLKAASYLIGHGFTNVRTLAATILTSCLTRHQLEPCSVRRSHLHRPGERNTSYEPLRYR